MIVKIQRPIITNDPDQCWLFYNQDHTYEEQRIPTKEEIKAMGTQMKMFGVYKNGRYKRKAPWQAW